MLQAVREPDDGDQAEEGSSEGGVKGVAVMDHEDGSVEDTDSGVTLIRDSDSTDSTEKHQSTLL